MFFFFTGLIFLNLFLYYDNYLFLLFLFVNVFYLYRKCEMKLFLLAVFGILVFYSFNINFYNFNTSEHYFVGEVVVSEKYDNYSIVDYNGGKYLLYNNDNLFYRGSVLYLEGEIDNIKDTYNSFYTYLNKKGVNYQIDYKKIYVVRNNEPFNEIVINKLLENKSEGSKSYLKLILFNDKDELNVNFYNVFSVYSLTYLVAVSGFHVEILLKFLKKVFKNNFVGYIFVCFYLYLLDFSVSSYRAFLCNVFKKINRKLGFCLSNNDILSLIGSVFIIVNPSIMFSYSFIYSFLATFVLEIFRVYTKSKFLMSFYIYMINVPLMLLNYYKLNLATLLFSMLLSFPVSFLYVFSFVYLFLDKFYILYELVINGYIKCFSFLDKLNLVAIFGKPSTVFVVLYYMCLLSYFIFKELKKNKRYLYLLFVCMLLAFQYSKPLLNNNEQFYFINVGQGDCMAFFIPNSKEVVLLDTGGSKYSDVAINKVIPFLESKGVNKIRKVIISHDDFDHNGSLNSLKDNFNVEEIVETSNIEEIIIGDSVFKNLNVSERRDNEGSLVLYGEYGGYKLLLMGDASKSVEKNLMYDVDNVDIIKIGHHGSNTSSDYVFLDKIDGKVAIISVGKNNSYGHPHKEVLEYLEKLGYLVLRSDENNNIGFGKNILGLSFVDYFK